MTIARSLPNDKLATNRNSDNPARRAFAGSPAHSYVKQMVARDRDRFQRVNDHRYLAIIENDANPRPRIPVTVETSGEHILVVAGPTSQKFSRAALGQSDRILDYLGLVDDSNRVFEQMLTAFAKAHRIDAETQAATEREAAERAERLATIRRNGNGSFANGHHGATCQRCGQNWRRCGCPELVEAPAPAPSVEAQKRAARASLNGALNSQQPKARIGSLPTNWRNR